MLSYLLWVPCIESLVQLENITRFYSLQAISQIGLKIFHLIKSNFVDDIYQVAEGTQRLLEPVSKITLNGWPGVPSSIGP